MAKKSAQKPDHGAKLTKDHEAIKEGILAVTLNWANLESSMAVLLGQIIRDPKINLGSAIYFAINNAEARFDVVHHALMALLLHQYPGSERGALVSEWEFFCKKLQKARANRNKVIHGSITTIHKHGKSQVRLTPLMFDFARTLPAIAADQWPGLSRNEVAGIANRISLLNSHTRLFSGTIGLMKQDDKPTFRKKLRELEEYRRHYGGRHKDAPNPPKP